MEDLEKNEAIKEYEISFLVPTVEGEAKVDQVLVDFGAEVYMKNPAKEARLFYPIQKYSSALLGTYNFRVLPEKIKEIDEALSLVPEVLRFLIVTPPILKPMAMPRRMGDQQRVGVSDEQKPVETLTNEALEVQLKALMN